MIWYENVNLSMHLPWASQGKNVFHEIFDGNKWFSQPDDEFLKLYTYVHITYTFTMY